MRHPLIAAAVAALLATACNGGGAPEEDPVEYGTAAECATAPPVLTDAALPPDEPIAPHDADPTARAAGSVHRFSWAKADSATCEAVLQLWLADGTVLPLARQLPDTGDQLVTVPDLVGAQARVYVQHSCSAAAKPVNDAFRISASQAVPNYGWERMTAAAPFPGRDGAGALVLGERMWLLGGWRPDDPINTPGITSNAVWSSADGVSWRRDKCNTHETRVAAVLPPDWAGRHTAGYALAGGRMPIIGGDAVGGQYQQDVWSSADGFRWRREATVQPFAKRLLFQSFSHRGRACIFGGQSIPQFVPDEERLHDDVWCSDTSATWTRVDTITAPPGRAGMLGQAVRGDEVWIIGGGKYHTPSSGTLGFNDVWRTTDLVHWERVIEHAPWDGRIYHNVAAFDGRLWVMGGLAGDGRLLSDTWYSADGRNWYVLAGTPWSTRHAASVHVFRNALWLVAGAARATSSSSTTSGAWPAPRAEPCEDRSA